MRISYWSSHVCSSVLTLATQRFIGAIAGQHHGIAQVLVQIACPLARAFHQLDLDAAVLQRLGKTKADVAAAGKHDATHWAVETAQIGDDLREIGSEHV